MRAYRHRESILVWFDMKRRKKEQSNQRLRKK